MIQSLINRVAHQPRVSDACRHLLEGQFRVLKQVVSDFIASSCGVVLDCGCGTGIFASLCSVDRYLGIDVSEPSLKVARRRCPRHRFIQMDAKHLVFPAQSLNRIIVVGLLHHLCDEEVDRVCIELNRVMAPDGELLVMEDIPTTKFWNVVGRTVHQLDLGNYIRTKDRYQRLLDKQFSVRSVKLLESGFMDYAVFHCAKSIIPAANISYLYEPMLAEEFALEVEKNRDRRIDSLNP